MAKAKKKPVEVRKVKIPSREEEPTIYRSASRHNSSLFKEIEKVLPKHEKQITPYEQHALFVEGLQREYATSGLDPTKAVMEFAQLSDADKEKKLQKLQAGSNWAAFYDLQAYPPKEAYSENEDFFQQVPYFKACIELRAENSVGVGFEIKDTTDSEDKSPQETFLEEAVDKIDLGNKMIKAQIHRDLYGNAYWHLTWRYNSQNQKAGLQRLFVVQPPRMRIRLTREVGNKIIGYVYIPPQLIVGYFPQPVALTIDELVHFKGDDFSDIPYGFSKVFGLREILQARWDINVLMPIFFRHYAKPWIHWSVNTEGLTPGQAGDRIDDLSTLMANAGPDSDIITDHRAVPTVFTASQAIKDPQFFMEDMDNQIFGQMKVPETYFKAKGTTDRMILKQDDNFVKEMKKIQEYFAKKIETEIFLPLLEAKFGKRVESEVIDPITGINEKKWSYEIPEIVWNEVVDEAKNEKVQRVIAMINAGLFTTNRALKELGEEPLSEEEQMEQNGLAQLNETQPPVGQQPEQPQQPKENLKPKQPLGNINTLE